MPIAPLAQHRLGDMIVRYQRAVDGSGPPGLVLFPAARADAVVTPREHLDAPSITSLPSSWLPMRAWEVDPLVHLHVRGDPWPGAFSQGRTLRGSPSNDRLRFVSQQVRRERRTTEIITTLRDNGGLVVRHRLTHASGDAAVRMSTTAINRGKAPLTLDLLTSFSLGGLTPFAADDAPGRLRLHRLRATWSAEGRHEVRTFEDLQLERSWIGHGVACERFGQVGSMPVNGWYPLAAVEDTVAGVTWAVQLCHPGSWQLELWRRKDQAALSGGLADREFGHCSKTLRPGESLESPEAWLTCTAGTFDDACERLKTLHRVALRNLPRAERGLPVVFNEWCTSWGTPTHENLIALADRLKGTGVRYLVIDDGWAERPGGGIQQNGDWNVNRRAFPHGLKATCDALRARGLVPGIWFEFEVVNAGSKAWNETRHLLHRDGQVLEVGNRRFWDFRDPWVHAYLHRKVTGLLRRNGFGYLKVDYNDTLGLGVDGAESPGEGLRAHLAGVQRFFRELRRRLPDLVIENCSSGGHRQEPSMIGLTAMSSFSDAHETPDIPIIAANLHRVMPPRQSQIWAVLRSSDTLDRLSYSLAAGFLGRLCLSGELPALNPAQDAFVRAALRCYQRQAGLISDARFVRTHEAGPSWQHPQGLQIVRADAADGDRVLIVWHTFADAPREAWVALPPGRWQLDDQLAARAPGLRFGQRGVRLTALTAWSGGVVVLRRRKPPQPRSPVRQEPQLKRS